MVIYSRCRFLRGLTVVATGEGVCCFDAPADQMSAKIMNVCYTGRRGLLFYFENIFYRPFKVRARGVIIFPALLIRDGLV